MTLDQKLTKYCINCRNYCLLGNTNSRLIRYKNSICAQQVKGFQNILCLRYSATLPISSVMFTCDDLANNPQPTSTFSATATRIAGGVATSPAQGTNPATSSKISASAKTGGSLSPTSASAGNSGSSSGSASSTGSSGLNVSDKIAICVRVGIGIPSIIIALVAWLWPRLGQVGGGHMRNKGWN
jgi:hypothetical protein